MSDKKQEKRKVAIIGAGLGGLSCAVRLAHAGYSVVIYEKNDSPGGKINTLSDGGYSWDTGPSLLTMPQVLRELWQDVGRKLEDYLTLEPLNPSCRYRWHDGTLIDENADFWLRPDVTRFLAHARGVYEFLDGSFFERSADDWWQDVPGRLLSKLNQLPKVLSMKSLHALTHSYFSDPHLIQIFDRFACYNGSSPYLTPSFFSIIPFLQQKYGAWRVQGGIHRIITALTQLARESGVEIRTKAEVTGFHVHAGSYHIAVDGRWEKFDGAICNQDTLHAYEHLLPRAAGEHFRNKRLGHTPLSSSAYLLFLGVKKQYEGLAHRNLFFSDDDPREFHQIFDERQPAEKPSILVTVSSRSEPGHAPEGCDNWLVQVNAPALRSRSSWKSISESYGDRIIELLEEFGFPGLKNEIDVRHNFSPSNFRSQYRSYAGSLYGFASHGLLSPFKRPQPGHTGWNAFSFVGGSTHQAGGIPVVMM
jgi:phytoene desaturase